MCVCEAKKKAYKSAVNNPVQYYLPRAYGKMLKSCQLYLAVSTILKSWWLFGMEGIHPHTQCAPTFGRVSCGVCFSTAWESQTTQAPLFYVSTTYPPPAAICFWFFDEPAQSFSRGCFFRVMLPCQPHAHTSKCKK